MLVENSLSLSPTFDSQLLPTIRTYLCNTNTIHRHSDTYCTYVEDVWLSSISAYYSVSFSLSCCSELRQETLVRTQAAKRSSQFEEGEDKAAELQKQVKKYKSEKRAVEDVSCCQVELLVCVFLCVFCVLSLILKTCVQFQVHNAACHVLTVEQVLAPHGMVHFLYITYVHTYMWPIYTYVLVWCICTHIATAGQYSFVVQTGVRKPWARVSTRNV